MKIHHPNIELLERFALRRAALPPDEIDGINKHIGECAYCRDILYEIEDLNRQTEDVDEILVSMETARIMRLIPAGSRRSVNELILHLRPETAWQKTPGGFALAAKSESIQLDYQPIATLYSDDGRTLLRILHERENATYFFQLMSEQTDHIPHALLVSPGKGPMMTDVDGAFRIPDSEIDIVQIVSMSVFYALDRMRTGRIESRELASHEGVVLASEDSIVHLRSTGEGLEARVRWHGPDDNAPRYIGAVSPYGDEVGVIENETARLSLSSLPEDCTLVLY
ncbi:MAG: hypothetical protein WC824_15745 [Bacteroidota bacterium]|jgi:hypothetical protein